MIRSTGTIISQPYLRVENVFRLNKLMQGKWMAGWVDRSTGQWERKDKLKKKLTIVIFVCLLVCSWVVWMCGWVDRSAGRRFTG